MSENRGKIERPKSKTVLKTEIQCAWESSGKMGCHPEKAPFLVMIAMEKIVSPKPPQLDFEFFLIKMKATIAIILCSPINHLPARSIMQKMPMAGIAPHDYLMPTRLLVPMTLTLNNRPMTLTRISWQS